MIVRKTSEHLKLFVALPKSGVRFLSGKPIKENWLPKNQAYQQLLDEANGEYVLFAGVDCRVEPDSLRHLVEAALQKKKSMVSIIPSNSLLRTEGSKESVLLQPARYAWELSLPRKMFNRPPVLSTCWLISRKFLLSTGGFAAVSRSVVPESYFARVSSVHDGYSFMQSNEYIGIKSMKDAPAQWATRRPHALSAVTSSSGARIAHDGGGAFRVYNAVSVYTNISSQRFAFVYVHFWL